MEEERADSVVIRAVSGDVEGKKVVENVEVKDTRRPDTLRHVEKKLRDKGIRRMDRHPIHGLGLARGPPKSGHGGKFTWEGPTGVAEAELEAELDPLDPNDPNYIEEEEDELIVGEVEVAKAAEGSEGISRIEIRPPLRP